MILKRAVILISIVFTASFLLSRIAGVAYIYTILGFSVWAFVGHLVTFDDELPGEWGNPEGSEKIWQSAKIQLLIKFMVCAVLAGLALSFPVLSEYGA